MKKNVKRHLTALLAAFVLCMGGFSMTAFAQSNEAEAAADPAATQEAQARLPPGRTRPQAGNLPPKILHPVQTRKAP